MDETRTLVGVDIGSYSVKCVVLGEDKSKYRLVQEQYLLSIMITFWLSLFSLRCHTDRFCEPSSYSVSCVLFYSFLYITVCVYASVSSSQVSSTELSQGIRYEMQERSLIEDVDDYHYQWEILNTLDDVYQVLSVAIRKDIVAMLRKIKRRGGQFTP